jgi:Fur family ferric uptake transcriptional regulator
MKRLEALCRDRGLKLTAPRRLVLSVLDEARDHPSAKEIHRRASERRRIALGTVYRILDKLVDAGVLLRHAFGGGGQRYEAPSRRHHHLVDVRTGQIVEFDDHGLTVSVERVAAKLGYRLVDFKLEVTGRRKD